MTIQQAINRLIQLREKHGDVQVYFDCPYCGKSCRPSEVVAVVVARGDAEGR